MFTGYQPTDLTKDGKMSKDDKLQSLKEMGIIFEYINTHSVFDKFCATYEAIYPLLGLWDQAYAATALNPPSLQDEWKAYIRIVLDSLVLQSRVTFEAMFWAGSA
ncbi:hypothetical protein BDW59DRAFT_162394 [Aspergillus cavernicola]|uniref:EF-hand domain-containing protein n=1 Tax=Aspergillus cavernicola TaxID=176166 RepID=A0ABR4I9V6_9EURO